MLLLENFEVAKVKSFIEVFLIFITVGNIICESSKGMRKVPFL